MGGLRNRILCGGAGASAGLSGILSVARCYGNACTSCFGCFGVGACILLVVLADKAKGNKDKEQAKEGN